MNKKTKPKVPDLGGELLASLKVPRLEEENAALRKRVAELEACIGGQTFELEKCLRQIADLQSQLAWTPVSDGLPTEEGLFVFEEDDNGHLEPFWHSGYLWRDRNGELVDPAYLEDECRRFRRIELPKEGET